MAGTEVEISVEGFTIAQRRAIVAFLRSEFHSAGLVMRTQYVPSYPKHMRTVTIDGLLADFVHRAPKIGPALTSFGKVLALQYGPVVARRARRQVFKPMLEGRLRAISAVESVVSRYGGSIGVVRLSRATADVFDRTERMHVKSAIYDLQLACILLHDEPYDPTFALIAADRAVETYLKGELRVLKCRFPLLLSTAVSARILRDSDAGTLEVVHKMRNKVQHEGAEAEFDDSFDSVMAIISVLEPLLIASSG